MSRDLISDVQGRLLIGKTIREAMFGNEKPLQLLLKSKAREGEIHFWRDGFPYKKANERWTRVRESPYEEDIFTREELERLGWRKEDIDNFFDKEKFAYNNAIERERDGARRRDYKPRLDQLGVIRFEDWKDVRNQLIGSRAYLSYKRRDGKTSRKPFILDEVSARKIMEDNAKPSTATFHILKNRFGENIVTWKNYIFPLEAFNILFGECIEQRMYYKRTEYEGYPRMQVFDRTGSVRGEERNPHTTNGHSGRWSTEDPDGKIRKDPYQIQFKGPKGENIFEWERGDRERYTDNNKDKQLEIPYNRI